MTAYFDRAESEARGQLDLSNVVCIESLVLRDVLPCVRDREFPEDLRERAWQLIGRWSLVSVNNIAPSREAKDWYATVKRSKLLDSLHDLFHDLARRRIVARFGLLQDDPSSIAKSIRELREAEERV